MADAPTSGVFVLDAQVPEERAHWLSVWRRWPAREVFAHPAYVELEADGDRARAKAAVFETDHGTVIYPFLQRRLELEPCWTPEIANASDITAPYGYGGPYAWGVTDRDAFAKHFWSGFDAWAARETIVSEFVRFSLFTDTCLPYPGEVEERQGNVVRSLDAPLDSMWMDFEHKVRKNVKKAQRSGIVIVQDEGERIESFMAIYAHTMGRRAAHERYHFSLEYFTRVEQTLAGQFRYFHALLNGRIVSTELVLVSADNVYSFLGGTSEDAFEFRPNDLLKYAVIEWAKERGMRHFVLGGGYEPDDGIFRYKLSFAPHGRLPFFVGRRILRPDLYQRLVDKRIELAAADGKFLPRQDFFPAYRG